MLRKFADLRQKRILIVMGMCCCLALTACGSRADKYGSKVAEDGRNYGGLISGEMNETIETAFFDVTVENAKKYNTFQFVDALYQANEGETYLVVTLKIENTYEEDIPMSITDFTLDYDGNKSESVIIGYGKADVNQNDFMDNIFTLEKGESVTKSIVYIVKDKKEYTVNYKEYYEDEFQGDAYSIVVVPEKVAMNNESSVDTSTEEATTGDSTNDTSESNEGATE